MRILKVPNRADLLAGHYDRYTEVELIFLGQFGIVMGG
jgi:hypothetical protein